MKKEIFKTGSFYVNNEIFDTTLSANAKLVYIYLAKCADCFGKSFPAHKTIGEACSISVTTVKESLKELLEYGKITISKRFREQGGKSSNLYMLMDRSKEHSFCASPLIFGKELSAKAKLVYFYFCRCADGEGTCFPAHKTTAAKCSMGFSTVRRALSELVEAAVIGVVKRFRADNGQTSNLYRLCQLVSRAVESVQEKIQECKKKQNRNKKTETKQPIQMKNALSSWLKQRVSRFRAGSIGNIEQPPCSYPTMKELNSY